MIRKLMILFLVFLFAVAGCGTGGESSNGNTGNNEDISTGETESIDVEQLQLEANITQTSGDLIFDFYVENNNEVDADFTFPSSQKYDIVVSDKSGNEAYRYSEDKMFTEAIEHVTIPAGEKLTFSEQWQLPPDLEIGNYTVNINITASEVNGEQINADTISKSVTTDITKQNTAFRNIKVSGENGEYVVSGEARVFEATFFYTVEEGHEYLIDETLVRAQEGAPSWSPFELTISIPENKLPANGTLTLELYERSAKDGSRTNNYLVKLDQIKK